MKRFFSFLVMLAILLSLAAPALPARAEQAADEPVEAGPDLRVGILSDIHVSTDYFGGVQPERWRNVLQIYKTMDLDAIVVAGDLQENAGTSEADIAKQKQWIDIVVDTWYEVFPEEPGEEGYVEPIFIYGNHDATLVTEQYWPEEWGSYQDSYVKQVNGYQFVGVHNAKEHTAGTLVSSAVERTPDKPVFYIQHCPIFNTVPSSGDTGYGTGYARNGRNNISDYHNVVAFSGHTHTPLTDERAIWQGADWNDGQFTSITCGTINYSYVNEDGMSINGNGNLTQHGLLMEVTGSQVHIDRYHFGDATVENGVVTGLVKLGDSWDFDACDPTDRPYTFEKQKAAATAPVFPEGSSLTVSALKDTSVSVTMPGANNIQLLRYYMVEAIDPLTGAVEGSSKLSAEYHITRDPANFGDSYSLTVSGLLPGKSYILRGYAVDFFENRSLCLETMIKTTGTAQPGQAGDVNGDGKRNDADQLALHMILNAGAEPTAWADVDGNNVIEQADMTALKNILAGNRPVEESPEADLFGHSDKQTIGSGGATVTEQSAVVRGDSAVAIEVRADSAAGWPYTRVFFDTPQDLSGANVLYMDTLFPNEPVARYRYFTLSFISGDVENWSDQLTMYLDPNYEGWVTTAVDLNKFDNVDWERVTGLRFNFNLDSASDRPFDVQPHCVYIDNVRFGLAEPAGTDTDLFATATVAGGDVTCARGQVRDSHTGIGSNSGLVKTTLAEALTVGQGSRITFDVKAESAALQLLDAAGSPVGNSVTLNTVSGEWVENTVTAEALGITADTDVASLQFTFEGTLYLDNLSHKMQIIYDDEPLDFNPLEDTLKAAVATVYPPEQTNDDFVLELLDSYDGRQNVLHMLSDPDGASAATAGYMQTGYRIRSVQDYMGTLKNYDYFQFTIQETGVYPEIAFYFKDASGNVLGQTTNYRTARTSEWATYRIDLDTLGLTAEELPLVEEIVFRFWWGYQMTADTSADRSVGEIYIDDAGFCAIPKDADLFDRVNLIRNTDYWYGWWNHYPGAGWLYQDDITVGSDSAFMYHRSPGTTGNYNGRTLYMYFDEPMTVGSDWIISMDVINENYAHNCVVEFIGSDGNYYRFFAVNTTGESRPVKVVSQLDGFDPATVNIIGLKLTNLINADTNVDDTKPGYLIYDNLTIQEPAPEEEVVIDMLDSASYEYGNTAWNSGGIFTYTNACTDVTSTTSPTSWQFGATAEGGGWPMIQLHLNGSYDMTGKDLVFDIKFEHDNDQPRKSIGIRLYDNTWTCVTEDTNYGTLGGVIPGDGWQRVVIDSGVIQAKLKQDRDLTKITLISFQFAFENDKGYPRKITIDNMHLADDVEGTAETDAATDLLANATYTVETADSENFGYIHNAEGFGHGDESLYAHKFYATPTAEGDISVLYTLDKSYDLTNKNLEMDVMFFHAPGYFYVQLFDSNMVQVTSGSGSIQGSTYADINIDLLSALQSGADLRDVKYIRINTRFANNGYNNKAVYVDNVRIFDIDVYDTPLKGSNVLFIGDSITVASPFKGWDGELKEHYGIHNYNVGVGGASYMSKSGRSLIANQVSKIDHTVDYEYIIINGGVNDIWDLGTENDTVLGQVSDLPVTSDYEAFDASTTTSGMERLFAYLKQNFPNAKIGFIITYGCDLAGYSRDNYIDLFVPLAQAVCDKWSIPYFDIVNHPVLGTEFEAHEYVHTVDGVHANNHGYSLIVEHLAPWMLTLKRPTSVATEATERASDLLGGASYEWSASAWTGVRSYDTACTDVYGDESLRSWKFSTTTESGGYPAMQICFAKADVFDLTDRALQLDVKFQCDGAAPSQKLGMRLFDSGWKGLIGDNILWVDGDGSEGWQTITIDEAKFEPLLVEGEALDQIYLIQLFFDFATNEGKAQSVTIDNMRVKEKEPTSEDQLLENASDMLANATYVSGNFDDTKFFYDPQCSTVYGSDSLYSKKFSAADGLESWPGAMLDLGKSYDLTGKGLRFDLTFINAYKTLGIKLYDSNQELVCDASTDLVYSQWHTVDVDLLKKVTEGKDLSDVRYIRFGFTFLTRYTDQAVVIDNLRTYDMHKAETQLSGKTALYLGDSISEAIGFKGWAGELEEHYGVKRYNVSSSGAVLASGQGHRILTQLSKAPADVDFDFVLANGGVNDVWMGSVEMGAVTAAGVTSFDTTTTAGALEELFSTLKTNYPNAKIGFILNYNCAGAGFNSDKFRDEFAPIARAACEKWDVYCLDLVDNAAFTAAFSATAGSHTYDGVHANQAGYEVLTTYISQWMGSMIGVQVPSMEEIIPQPATESSEQDSDLLAYADLAWNPAEWGTVRFYDPDCTDVCGFDSTRSWKFSTTAEGQGWPAMQISLPKVNSFDLAGKAIEFDVKFENARQAVGMQIFDKGWNSYTGNTFIWQFGDDSEGWQTFRYTADEFVAKLEEGKSLDRVYLIRFIFDFETNKGKEQAVIIDNVRIVDLDMPTQAQEAASDLLANATYISGDIDKVSYFRNDSCKIVNGENSLYSKKLYALDGTSGTPKAMYDLGRSYDMTGKTLSMDFRFVNMMKYIAVNLYDSNRELVTNVKFYVYIDHWNPIQLDITRNLESGKDLTDIRYVEFQAWFTEAKSGRAVYIDNMQLTDTVTVDSVLTGKNVLFMGDSISESGCFKAWAGELAEHYGVNRYNVSASGAVIVAGQGHRLLDQLSKAPADVDIDYIILNGGVNDVWLGDTPMGAVTAAGVTEFDTATTAGAMEELFATLKTRYPNAKIGFIINYNCSGGGFDSDKFRDEFAPMARAVCEKWEIPYLDLVNNAAFNAEFSSEIGSHTYDGVHANQEGYDILTNYIAPFMGTLTGDTVPAYRDLEN